MFRGCCCLYLFMCLFFFFFFFFQAEDGIRDLTVTGVQTLLFRSRRGTSRSALYWQSRCDLWTSSPESATGWLFREQTSIYSSAASPTRRSRITRRRRC